MLRGCLAKNANIYWISATSLAAWFLFRHTPNFWKHRSTLLKRDTLLAIHIVEAGCVYLACAHNCLLTPSLHQVTKLLHRWIGRFGLVSGLVSFSLGAFLAWSRLGIVGAGSTTLGFAVPITIGGILQLQCEYKGFRAIRTYKALQDEIEKIQEDGRSKDQHRIETLVADQKKALRTHIGYMISLFVCACGIPAGIRLAEFLARGDEGVVGTVALLSVIGLLQYLSGLYIRKLVPPAPSDTKST